MAQRLGNWEKEVIRKADTLLGLWENNQERERGQIYLGQLCYKTKR